MALIQGVVNAENWTESAVVMDQFFPQLDGGRVRLYVLYVNGEPVDNAASLDRVLAWYETRRQQVKNPIRVVSVAVHNVGVLEIRSAHN